MPVPDVVAVALAGGATALATGAGAIPVFALGAHAERLRPALWGLAAGVMTVAAVAGLLLPALEVGGPRDVAIGSVAGVAFLLTARATIERRDPVGAPAGRRQALLVCGVLFAHSIPEGLAIGTAWASSTDGLALFVVLAIALQNVPEGTVTAIPLALSGVSRTRQFWAAVATSAPQPVAAVAAFLMVERVTALLPVSFAFAGAAMLALTVTDLLPSAMGSRATRRSGALGLGAGTALMLLALWAIGV